MFSSGYSNPELAFDSGDIIYVEERTPITKQMISHIESKAQDIARIKKLQEHQTVNEN